MKRPRLLIAALSSALVAGAFVLACVGDDPGSTTTSCLTTNTCADGSSSDSPSGGDTGTPGNNDGGDGGGTGADADAGCTQPCNGSLVWLHSFGSTAGDSIISTTVDRDGNSYLLAYAGAALGLADDGGAPSLNAPGLFAARFNADGTPGWVRAVTGTLPGTTRLAVDKTGALYVAGNYYNANGATPMSWGLQATGLGSTGANTSPDGYDIFVLKINAMTGDFLSARQLGSGGNGYDDLYALGIDADDIPIIAGRTTNAIGIIAAGGFIAKLGGASLLPSWSHSVTAAGITGFLPSTIFPMTNADIGVVGTYTGTIDFHPTGGGGTSSSNATQTFLIRLDKNGSLPAGNDNFQTIYNGVNSTTGQTTVSSAAFFGGANPSVGVVGQFRDQVNIGGLTAQLVTDAGAKATYVAHLSTTLNPLDYRGIFDSASTSEKQIAMSSKGEVIVSGGLKGSTDYGGGSVTSAGDEDGFVAFYDPTIKNLRWSQLFGGPVADRVRGMGVDPNDNVVVIGEFQATANFPNGKSLTSKNGKTNIFVMKLAR